MSALLYCSPYFRTKRAFYAIRASNGALISAPIFDCTSTNMREPSDKSRSQDTEALSALIGKTEKRRQWIKLSPFILAFLYAGTTYFVGSHDDAKNLEAWLEAQLEELVLQRDESPESYDKRLNNRAQQLLADSFTLQYSGSLLSRKTVLESSLIPPGSALRATRIVAFNAQEDKRGQYRITASIEVSDSGPEFLHPRLFDIKALLDSSGRSAQYLHLSIDSNHDHQPEERP